MTEPHVLVADRDVEDGVIRVLTMNRPAARNAMDTAMLAELVDGLADAAGDERVLGVLLTGAEGTFSAGADVREELGDGGTRRMELFATFYETLATHPKPTAAAIEGPAVGGGAEAAAACDLRCAGRSARIRFPGAIYGIPIGTARTLGLLGLGTAKDWVLSSRDVSADEAHRVGFLQRIVDDGEAEAAAFDWLSLVATRDRATVTRLKKAFNVLAGLEDRIAWENDAIRGLYEDVPPLRPGPFGMPAGGQEV